MQGCTISSERATLEIHRLIWLFQQDWKPLPVNLKARQVLKTPKYKIISQYNMWNSTEERITIAFLRCTTSSKKQSQFHRTKFSSYRIRSSGSYHQQVHSHSRKASLDVLFVNNGRLCQLNLKARKRMTRNPQNTKIKSFKRECWRNKLLKECRSICWDALIFGRQSSTF